MRDISLKRHEILDPPGKLYWPIYRGRDGCRSPMQWDGSPNAGFSSARPWLPVHPGHLQRNVAAQQADPGSLFHFTKRLLALRKELHALRHGGLAFLPGGPAGWTHRGILLYTRQLEGQAVLVAINFKNKTTDFHMPSGKWEPLFSNQEKIEPGILAPFQVCLMKSSQ